jgi:hypothetical protein
MAPSSLQQTNGVPHATAERLRQVPLDQDSTLVAVIEMGQASWLVAAIVPSLNRHPLKKIATDAEQLLQVLRGWKKEAETAGRMVKRVAVAYEPGRDGFWLARWLRAHGIEAYVIHPSSGCSGQLKAGRISGAFDDLDGPVTNLTRASRRLAPL